MDQLSRQRDLGRFLGEMLGWTSHFFFIGPEHGARPSTSDCVFVSWGAIAAEFKDVPQIAEYIREFAFFYRGRWQSMVEAHRDSPGRTAYDLLLARPAQVVTDPTSLHQPVNPAMPVRATTPAAPKANGREPDPWHFSHLGKDFFLSRVFYPAKHSGFWPISYVYTGMTGVPYVEKSNGRQINANWMVEDSRGRRRTNRRGFEQEHAWNLSKVRRWRYQDVADYWSIALT
jgi:hypothetical protein